MLKNLFVEMTLKGWRRIDLAEKADVPAWQIVRCIKHPKLYRFKAEEKLRIANALGVESNRLDWLFAETDERFDKEAAHENVRTSTDI